MTDAAQVDRSAESGARLFRDFASDFLRYGGARGWLLGFYLAVGAVVEGLGVLLLLPLVTIVTGSSSGNGWIDGITKSIAALAPGSTIAWKLAFVLMLFALLVGFRSFIILNRDVLMERLQSGFVEALRLRIVTALADCSWETVSRLKHGRIMHVLAQDVDECGNAAFLLLRSAAAVALLVGQWALVVLVSPKFAMVILSMIALAVIVLRPSLRHSADLGRGMADSNLNLIVETGQFLGGLKLALSQDLQHSFLAEFRRVQDGAVWRRIAFTRHRAFTQLTLTATVALMGGVVVLIGVGYFHTAPAVLFTLLFVLARLSGPVGQIQTSAQRISHSMPTYRKVKALQAELSATPHTDKIKHGRSVGVPSGGIELDAVTYLHAGLERAGVSAFSLRIEPGEIIGLAGPSGAGKTTLADLIVGLYTPQAGAIRIGSQALEGPVLDSWRQALSYVAQDPFLFHDSIRMNLLWARPNASDEDMWEALILADAAPMVRLLSAGLDAIVGERGALLSGGERQRIALARALIRRPSFLVLDEATSAIDPDGEARIMAQLRNLVPRPTILMIAHRAESLALCDRTVEMP